MREERRDHVDDARLQRRPAHADRAPHPGVPGPDQQHEPGDDEDRRSTSCRRRGRSRHRRGCATGAKMNRAPARTSRRPRSGESSRSGAPAWPAPSRGRRRGSAPRRAARTPGRCRAARSGTSRSAARRARAAAPAMQPSRVDPVSRRTSRHITSTIKRADQRRREPPAERRHPEDPLADGDHPLADLGVDDLARARRRRCPSSSPELMILSASLPFVVVAVVDEVRRVVLDQQRVRVLGVVRLVERDVVRRVEVPEVQDAGEQRDDERRRASPTTGRCGKYGGVSRRRSRGSGSPSTVRPSSATDWVEWRTSARSRCRVARRSSVVVATSAMRRRVPVPRCDDAGYDTRAGRDADRPGRGRVTAPGDRARPGRRRRRRGHPPAAPAGRPTSASTIDGAGRVLLRGQRGGAHGRAAGGAASPASASCSSPTPACRACPTPATGWWRPRSRPTSRSPSCPGPSAVLTALAVSGLAGRPVLLRGLPAAQGRRAAPATGRARGRAAHHGVLRGAAPHGRDARGDGRGVRRRPAGGGLP